MKRWLTATALLGAILVPLSGCETVEPRYGEVEVAGRGGHARIIFSDNDRLLIREYYAPRRYQGLPPGLAKQGKIPPGHARQMMRDGRLPPDVPYHYLPRDLDGRLSRLPEDHVRVIVGTDIGIMNTRTRVVVDVIEDIAHHD
jgi:hypothetical protein